MTLAISLAVFASIVCALGGALLANAVQGARLRRRLETLAAEHASALATLETRATQSAASQQAVERALGLDRVGSASAHSLVADACTTAGAAVATLAGADGLALAWSGDHDVAEELAALAPDALGVMRLGETLILRGAHGGEVRAVCVRFDGARCLLLFGGAVRSIGASALALLRLKLERLHTTEPSVDPRSGALAGRGKPSDRSATARALSADPTLSALAQSLDLRWLSGPSDALELGHDESAIHVGGTPPADALDELTMLERIARRSPITLCAPLASIQHVHGDGSSAWLALGALGSVVLGGAIADEPNALPRLAATIARRLSRETSRAA